MKSLFIACCTLLMSAALAAEAQNSFTEAEGDAI
jgi:hypothetical protein